MTTYSAPESITIDLIKYIRADLCQQQATGDRAIVVVDRGWIFAGDVTKTDTEITLSRAVHVFKWESIGFDGMVKDPKSSKVTLRKMNNEIKIPLASVIFLVPVDQNWGL
jgi:aspartokinase-like uncharacterized kinase